MSFENQIIQKRIEGQYLTTILKWFAQQEPMLDELVLLKRICLALDSKNLPYTRAEVRTATKVFYKKQYHGDLQSYLDFLAIGCTDKVVNVQKLKNRIGEKHNPISNNASVLIRTTKQAHLGMEKPQNDLGDIKQSGQLKLGGLI